MAFDFNWVLVADTLSLQIIDISTDCDDCDADLNRNGFVDGFDALAFLEAYADRSAPADFNADGVFDFFDCLAFLNSLEFGCP
jgi:hypothetical protein